MLYYFKTQYITKRSLLLREQLKNTQSFLQYPGETLGRKNSICTKIPVMS